MPGRRFASIESIQEQLSAWAQSTNSRQRGVDWQFTVENTRINLKHLPQKLNVIEALAASSTTSPSEHP